MFTMVSTVLMGIFIFCLCALTSAANDCSSRPDRFGSNCQYICHCTNDTCVSTGECRSGYGCILGWFGSKCQYMCHCSNNNCDNKGECTRGSTCSTGWFGPACQYSDLAVNAKIRIYPSGTETSYLTDGDHTTCLSTLSNITSVKLILPRDYLFTWLRIRVSDSNIMDKIQISFTTNDSNTIDCTNGRFSQVNNTIIDVFCDINDTVRDITIAGEGVKAFCSVYISGGRNIALGGNTSQYGVFYGKTAELAIDGNINDNFEKGSCSHTDTSTNRNVYAWWRMRFSEAKPISRIVIYNRVINNDKDVQDRLNGFILTAFNGTKPYSYKDPGLHFQKVYTIVMPTLQPTSEVVIQATNWDNNVANGYVLTLCEVEIFGDSDCPLGKYSRECEESCNCEGKECFVSTGGCSGCIAGYQGPNCDKKCQPPSYGPDCKNNCTYCLNGSCEAYFGVCYLCPVGKAGRFCDQDCPVKTFGANCSQICSINCGGNGHCNSSTGACKDGCKLGLMGPVCDQNCTHRYFGLNCMEKCENCGGDGSCSAQNGTCNQGCNDGYESLTCNKSCEYGKYGAQCSYKCSQNCTKADGKFCDHISGNCLVGCHNGNSGNFCELAASVGPDPESLVAPIVGGVAAFVGVLVIIAVVIGVICWRNRRHSKSSASQNIYSEEEVADTSSHRINNAFSKSAASVSLKVTKPEVPPKPEGKTCKVSKSPQTAKVEYINAVLDVPATNTSVALKDLPAFMSSHDTNFFKEQFLTIPVNDDATMTVGQHDENRSKNRYKNICAYDHSRVHLLTAKDKSHGDYINASYVEMYEAGKMFIASQGPTKAMLEDFVRMLWEQEVEIVVMLTNLVENGKEKCVRYWPEDDEMKVGEITVKLATTQVFADCTIRRLQLSKKGEEVMHLKHFHFTSWPDKDVPTAPWGLVDFDQRVSACKTSKPIVVHCSAGVGRTGTFIALWNIMRQAEDTGYMDFFSTVKQLRHDRMNMVQTADQYEFLHRAAQVAMICMDTTVTSQNIKYRIKKLAMSSGSGHTNMEDEFKAICNICNEDMAGKNDSESEEPTYHIYENSRRMINKSKNRLSNILPKEFYRVVLQCDHEGFEDYINAVFVPSFSKQNQQILTQLPLPTTVTDLWRLVTQYKVSLIVAFDGDMKQTDMTIGDYLPQGANMTSSFPPCDVTTESVTFSGLWEQQQLIVKTDSSRTANNTTDNEPGRELHVTYLNCSVKLDPENILTLVKHIRTLRPAGEGRILYMCRNGADKSGLLCILSLLLDRLDNDQCLTVPLVVGAIKAIRPQVIPMLDQYQLLYQVLDLYNDSLNVYTNFGDSTT